MTSSSSGTTSGWAVGFTAFAAMMMILIGFFQGAMGLVAVFNQDAGRDGDAELGEAHFRLVLVKIHVDASLQSIRVVSLREYSAYRPNPTYP